MIVSDISLIKYSCPPLRKGESDGVIKSVIGIDTEAYRTGECFMIALSDGTVFTPGEFPGYLFKRKFRGKIYVSYNLKYEISALLQSLPRPILEKLRCTGKVEVNGFKYFVIANKYLRITRKKNAIHFYDILQFFHTSLQKASQTYLSSSKIDLDPKYFYQYYVCQNWSEIASYCINDAELTRRLTMMLIERFSNMGIPVKKLFSIAYVSFQNFQQRANHVVVKRFWKDYKPLLSFALQSYNGGKFEVTTKGPSKYWEYDLISAYPNEIRNLIDISWARIERDKKFRPGSVYGFLKCKMSIPYNVYSPVAIKFGIVNTYPVGEYTKVITKNEYEYLISQGCDITILDAWWILLDNRQFCYRNEIDRLCRLKARYKASSDLLSYILSKTLMNALYGKFVQLIKNKEHFKAGRSWNPIYASIITANCRIRVSDLQQKHPEVCAVHTDSIISTAPLPYPEKGKLGELIYECEGDGVILGSGVYQIGNKVRFRGLEKGVTIMNTLKQNKKSLSIDYTHCNTWREVTAWGRDNTNINLFENRIKKINVRFDQKRLWLNDWQNWTEPLKRNVESAPRMIINGDTVI